MKQLVASIVGILLIVSLLVSALFLISPSETPISKLVKEEVYFDGVTVFDNKYIFYKINENNQFEEVTLRKGVKGYLDIQVIEGQENKYIADYKYSDEKRKLYSPEYKNKVIIVLDEKTKINNREEDYHIIIN